MRKLALCTLLFLVACEGPTDPQGPADTQGPPGEVVNHAPMIMAIVADWTNDYETSIVGIEVFISVVDKDGDDLIVTAKALAEHTDTRWSHLETVICTLSDSTPDQFSGYLSVDFDEIVTYRRIRFESWATDGVDTSQVNPAYNLNIQ